MITDKEAQLNIRRGELREVKRRNVEARIVTGSNIRLAA